MRGLLWVPLILLLSTCTDPVDIDTPRVNVSLISVDGFITTAPGPHVISLRRPETFDSDFIASFNEIQGAQVSIIDDLGEEIELEEVVEGEYHTPSDFAAQEGRSYQLNVEFRGERYQSTFEDVPERSEIRSIRNQGIDISFFQDNVESVREGVEYFVDVDFASEESYTLLAYDIVYEFRTAFPGRFTPRVCYVVENSERISNIASNASIESNTASDVQVTELVITFKYEYQHSVKAKLYSTNARAYGYFNKVLEQQQTSGSVFDRAPIQIDGNMISLDDPDEVVLGYFAVFNVDTARTFANYSSLNTFSTLDPCNTTGPGFPPPFCFDCTTVSNTAGTEKPSFWP